MRKMITLVIVIYNTNIMPLVILKRIRRRIKKRGIRRSEEILRHEHSIGINIKACSSLQKGFPCNKINSDVITGGPCYSKG